MIKYEIATTDNYYTEGFEFSIPSPLVIQCTDGTFNALGDEPIHYEGFELDIEADVDFEVVYDFYLVSDGSIHVDRTVIGADSIAMYEGDEVLKMTLSSIQIPANTADLTTIDIYVRGAKLDEEITSEQQVDSEGTTEEGEGSIPESEAPIEQG
jgi:hypothetical protein